MELDEEVVGTLPGNEFLMGERHDSPRASLVPHPRSPTLPDLSAYPPCPAYPPYLSYPSYPSYVRTARASSPVVSAPDECLRS